MEIIYCSETNLDQFLTKSEQEIAINLIKVIDTEIPHLVGRPSLATGTNLRHSSIEELCDNQHFDFCVLENLLIQVMGIDLGFDYHEQLLYRTMLERLVDRTIPTQLRILGATDLIKTMIASKRTDDMIEDLMSDVTLDKCDMSQKDYDGLNVITVDNDLDYLDGEREYIDDPDEFLACFETNLSVWSKA